MMKYQYLFIISIFLFSCNNAESQRKHNSTNSTKVVILDTARINGMCFVAPPKEIDNQWTADLTAVNVNWVAIIPYAFSRPGEPAVVYDYQRQYWGESVIGATINIRQAHTTGLKVMLKPQVWLQGSWVGDFGLSNEKDWRRWETDYENYLMTFTKLAIAENVEMICIGTEYRTAVKSRPEYWKSLITKIKKVYKGKLTYCANWDDYEDVMFWNELDYIGISAYFPLSDEQNPSVASLEKKWKPIKRRLANYSGEVGKPVLFTEYGYRSMDQPAWQSWEHEHKERPINNFAQAKAYEALYKTFWNENWFAGGFAWKWYSTFRRIDALKNHDWTPQHKEAEKVLKAYYGVEIKKSK